MVTEKGKNGEGLENQTNIEVEQKQKGNGGEGHECRVEEEKGEKKMVKAEDRRKMRCSQICKVKIIKKGLQCSVRRGRKK